ncbi:MAG: hypothetical protein ACTSPX_05735, partial [Candidatus Thorarchaeota archaeon]
MYAFNYYSLLSAHTELFAIVKTTGTVSDSRPDRMCFAIDNNRAARYLSNTSWACDRMPLGM